MTANTATARMATNTVKHQYYIYTRLLELLQLLQLLGSKEAFFCSLKIVTATAATVNKTDTLYKNIPRIYSKTVKTATVNTLFMCL